MSYNKLSKPKLLELCLEKNLNASKKMLKKDLIELLNESKSLELKINLDEQEDSPDQNVTNKQEDSTDQNVSDEEKESLKKDKKVDIDFDFIIEKFNYQDKIIELLLNEIKDLKLQLHNITNSKNNDTIFEDKQSILDENNNNNDTTFEDKQNIIDKNNENNETSFEDKQNVIINEEFSILKDKKNLYDNEVIDTLNQLYKIGIKFNNLLDVNCYDDLLINYIKEKDYPCKGLSLFKESDNYDLTDINISNITDNSYNIVVCFNLFEHLSKENIFTYYKNLLRVSNNYIIIKINDKNVNHYLEIFNNVLNENKTYNVNRFITNNLIKNLFILKKELNNKNF